jgi:protein TonB
MNRNDWIGLGSSVGVHTLLLLFMGLRMLATPEVPVQPPGMIEVEYGVVSQGRAVRPAPEKRDQTEQPQEEARKPDAPRPQVAPPREAKPVNLPKPQQPVRDPDKVQTSNAQNTSPQRQNNPAPVEQPRPQPESEPVRPLGSGDPQGTGTAADGDQGTGTEQRRSSPFSIAGLNRGLISSPLPRNIVNGNSTIKIRFWVDPEGKVTRTSIVQKGNPQLEQEALNALRRWRFSRLPAAAPQEEQSGVVTFRFVI